MEIRTDRFDTLPQIKIMPRGGPTASAPQPTDTFARAGSTPAQAPTDGHDPASQAAPVAHSPARTATPAGAAPAHATPGSTSAQTAAPAVLYVEESQFRELVEAMPKTELHTHIEGSVRPETILDLANTYHVELPADTIAELKSKIGMRPGENLLDFLKKFDCFRFVFDQPETLERLAYETIEDNANENVNYTEIRINPLKRPDKVSIGQVLDSILTGMDRARQELGVEAALIVSINRSYPLEKAWDVARAAVERKDRGVVGMDLAGDEVHHPPEKFKEIFAWTREQGLHLTIHAGEAVGAESVRKAIEECGAERIGHGVRSQEDPAVMDLVKERGVTLEMCPSSNLLLNVVDDMKAYPLARYRNQGVDVTINTDDRHIFDIDLTGEYVALARDTGLSLQDLQEISSNGIKASFLPEDRKQALAETFHQDMLAYNSKLARTFYTIKGS